MTMWEPQQRDKNPKRGSSGNANRQERVTGTKDASDRPIREISKAEERGGDREGQENHPD